MSEELKKIKKLYGEEMSHLCRELFPDILDDEGKLLDILKNTFYPNHRIASDIKKNCYKREFRNFIVNIYEKKDTIQKEIEVDYSEVESPYALLEQNGYVLYECKNESDIQSFRKYYTEDEEICTFNGGRLNFCYVFFAVKKNALDIQRKPVPQREDEYSTSVLSIQFSKNKPNYPVIISRYNESVFNPNATYCNNLDRIAPGLTESFKKYYGFSFEKEGKETDFLHKMRFVRGTIFDDDNFNNFIFNTKLTQLYFRYNFEKGGYYYCDDNVVIRNKYYENRYLDKSRYIFFDECILDRKNKELINYGYIGDSFLKATKLGKIVRTEYTVQPDLNVIKIYFTGDKYVTICTNKDNQMIYYENIFVNQIDSDFLFHNNTILYLNIPNVTIIRNNFMKHNNSVIEINSPLIKVIGNDFMVKNVTLKSFYTPNLKKVGLRYLPKNKRFSRVSSVNSYRDYSSKNKVANKSCLTQKTEFQRSRRFPAFRSSKIN